MLPLERAERAAKEVSQSPPHQQVETPIDVEEERRVGGAESIEVLGERKSGFTKES